VLLMESYGAMVEAARAGGRAIPELWPLGTEVLALAMEVSVLEAKRLGHRAVLRLSWLLLVASVALSTLLQVAVAPPTLVGYVTPAPLRCGCWAASPCWVCCTALTPAPTQRRSPQRSAPNSVQPAPTSRTQALKC
jgi:hypothetical protein